MSFVAPVTTRPSGTVTFLFTDIAASTQLWEQDRSAMAAALEHHDRLLRDAVETRGGYVFSTAGDGLGAAFSTPRAAVDAAAAAQRALQGGSRQDGTALRVRMGVHVGVTHERDGDYFGPAVNRAARVMALAHGGQILVSLAVEELVRDDLDEGCELVPLGEFALRGLARPETVYQLVGPSLARDFPPLTAGPAVEGNLPSPASTFVGRVAELRRVTAAVPQHRLVTLVGPGGVGKTRLALESAALLRDEFPDGVWCVELAPLSEPDAVVHAVATTLGVRPEPGQPVADSVVSALRSRRTLLVLDNCEHVVEAASEVAATVGRNAPGVAILATSREPLRVDGEQLWPVEPLDPASDAVELFAERAASVDPSLRLLEQDHQAVVGLCTALDGIPLAIELAAGRLRSMTVDELNERLDDRFRVLRRPGGRGAEARQETLMSTVQRS
jgi:class 3 adenylate cyclase